MNSHRSPQLLTQELWFSPYRWFSLETGFFRRFCSSPEAGAEVGGGHPGPDTGFVCGA